MSSQMANFLDQATAACGPKAHGKGRRRGILIIATHATAARKLHAVLDHHLACTSALW
jgi:hypothetical protein